MITKATRDRQREAETTRERELAELARVRWLLDHLLLDCTEIENGVVRCVHCRAEGAREIPHDAGCVVGQILLIRQQEKL